MTNFKRIAMNKRGEEQSTGTGAIIAAVIAVVVLVLVIIGLWMWFSGKGLPFFEYLPGFNQTKPPATGLEVLRYKFSEDKVQYYDGVKWNDFEMQKNVELNGKTLDYTKTYTSLVAYFFFDVDGERPIADRGTLTYRLVYQPGGSSPPMGWWDSLKAGFFGSYSKLQVKNGEVLIIPAGGGEGYALYLDGTLSGLTKDGKSYSYLPSLTNSQTLLKKDVIEWRDSVLNKPVEIGFTLENGKIESVKVCVDKSRYNSDKDLVVDLSNPMTGGVCT